MNTTFDTPNRNFTRDMFLFSTFTGICYCDMRTLTEEHIKKDHNGRLWIETTRQKTGTPENVMLLDVAIGIIEKYKGLAKEGKLFPMLTKESMNIHLKIIALAFRIQSSKAELFRKWVMQKCIANDRQPVVLQYNYAQIH